jgi:hypothetical protein
MKSIYFLAALLLSALLSPDASGQSACAMCRRAAVEDSLHCHQLAPGPAERVACDRAFADSNRDCASRVCVPELEEGTAARCSDCKSVANAQAQRCSALPVASPEQAACAVMAGDMLAACQVRSCRSPFSSSLSPP